MKWTNEDYRTYRNLVLPNIKNNTYDANIFRFYSTFINLTDSFLDLYVINRYMGSDFSYNDIVQTVNENLRDYIRFAYYGRTRGVPVCSFFSLYGYKVELYEMGMFKECKVWFDELGERTEFLFLTN